MGVANLRGRRVVIGLPGSGWRGDLRADSRVIQGSRTFVPVLPEHEWYRAEVEQTEVFAPLVAIERVWVETYGPATADQPMDAGVVARLVSLDAPPRHLPVAVSDAARVAGRRIVHVEPGAGEQADRRDLRAVTEPYTNVSGDICVRVVSETDWYRWAWSGQHPKTLELPIHELWLE